MAGLPRAGEALNLIWMEGRRSIFATPYVIEVLGYVPQYQDAV